MKNKKYDVNKLRSDFVYLLERYSNDSVVMPVILTEEELLILKLIDKLNYD